LSRSSSTAARALAAPAGGTPSKAPLGYLNVRKLEEGREIRTVEIDPERGSLVSWAFETYATGEWTQLALLEELARRGLDIPPTRRTVRRPVSLSYLQYMLKNAYYKGTVRYRGVDYDGKHHPPWLGDRRRRQSNTAETTELRC